jgi:endogenous inhibitor of DNA gyrase (YacG/DUF329 family)
MIEVTSVNCPMCQKALIEVWEVIEVDERGDSVQRYDLRCPACKLIVKDGALGGTKRP